MYEVVLINDKKETIINAVSTEKEAPKITGTIKKGINVIDKFTFIILPNNPGFNLIEPYKTRIRVINSKNQKIEFIGRIIPSGQDMKDNGLFSKSITAEGELGYLIDSIQNYNEYHNVSVREYLEKLIEYHNSRVENYKKFKVRDVTVEDSNDSLYRYTDYSSTWNNINDDLIDKLGGEIQVIHDEECIYIDYVKEIGKVSETEIRIRHNLKSISNQMKLENFYTRIKVLGMKLKIKDAEGNEVDSEERLTIESVNGGKDYLDYTEGIEKFGIIEGVITYDDVSEASNLLSKGQKFIESLKINISNTVTALDLSLIGLDFDSFEVGNYHPIIVEPLGINYTQRIVEKTIEIRNPSANSITLGDKQVNINNYYVNNNKIISKTSRENKENVAEIQARVGNLEKEVSSTNTENKSLLKRIQNVEGSLGSYVTIETFNKKINEINENFKKLDERLKKVEGGSTT